MALTEDQERALAEWRANPERARLLRDRPDDDEIRVIGTIHCHNASSGGWRMPWIRQRGVLLRSWIRAKLAGGRKPTWWRFHVRLWMTLRRWWAFGF